MSDLYTKVNQSVKLLKTVAKTIDGQIELCYSGGKDSDVILALAKMAGINYRAIYKNTTIDPPGTIKHCMENGVEIIQPKHTFFQLLEKKGLPSRFVRFCCSELKEYKILDNAIQGIRSCESRERSERYKEPIICRMYNKKEHVNTILPIVKWSNEDVGEFIKREKINCHPLYYTNGFFDVSKRLGCIGCPVSSARKRKEEFLQYPRLLRLWIKHTSVWFERMKENKGVSAQKFNNVYELFAYTLFYPNLIEFNLFRNNIFGTEDSKKLLEEYFKIDL